MKPHGGAQDRLGQTAKATRAALHERGIKTISLVGPPRSGKTSLLELTGNRLAGHTGIAFLVGNPAARQKASRLGELGLRALPLPGDQIDCAVVSQAISRLDLHRVELLLIDASGEMKYRLQRDHGQNLCVSVFSVAEGSDQPRRHPHLVAAADVVLLTMTDLLPIPRFDQEQFIRQARAIRPEAPVIALSVRDKTGVGLWLSWLEQQWIGRRRQNFSSDAVQEPFTDLSL